MPERLTYGSYLCIDDLLALQKQRSNPPHHDEMLFIVVHQVYELWFKQVLHEVDAAIRHLGADDPLRTTRALGRVRAIQRVLEEQVDVLETMTPHEFNEFRALLNPASGFQSAQFRELEFACGVGKTGYLRHLEQNDAERARLERRLASPTLYDALKSFLARRGYETSTPDELIETFRTIYDGAEQHVDLYLLLEAFIEFDERFLLWRGRHVRMVERMIGGKPGTGGSMGVRYLQTTLEKRFFPELWEVRTVLGEGVPAP
ncbi:MAG: tryptophan 2,3-dioxygenase [Candidatus Eremiobacteraeota bacterium]|nr:tryptophan 2,3-dioxygenase [Candidatus Eremiobacteraeota bacterium]